MSASAHASCSGCGKSFRADGLVRHQGKCKEYAAQEERRLKRWRSQAPAFVPFGHKRRRVEVAAAEEPRISQEVDQCETVVVAASGDDLLPTESSTSVAPLDQVLVEQSEQEPGSAGRQPSSGRPHRSNRGRLPARYRDNVPEGPAPLPPPSASPAGLPLCSRPEIVPQKTRTSANRFGLIREYDGPLPMVDPEDETPLDELADDSARRDSPADLSLGPDVTRTQRRGVLIAPYPNMSSFLFGRWFWNGAVTKSESDRADLLENCILHPEFNPQDLHGLNWKKIDRDLASTTADAGLWGSQDGWKFADVTLKVPLGNKTSPQDYTVSGLAYRPLEEVIAAVFSSELSAGFHYTPYQMLWQPPARPDGHDPPIEKVYGEVYTSCAFLDAHAELQRSPPEEGCNLPRAVVACMPWSDSTHLAEYGNASLWPIYLLFGNQSKYVRGRPSANACHHVAYIPKLPSDIDDLIHQHTTKEGIDKIVTHCRRELMHGIWRILLSDSFVHACRHGIVVKCYDGITRRLYPRFFTYSADYPEKALLATIRDMGNCPCPRCLVAKDAISAVGTPRDMSLRVRKARVDDVDRRYKVNLARSFIYEQGKGIASAAVENLLKPESLVPTNNAFSERLGEFLPNFHTLFVPDFLHEWELGVWKNIMIHLLRILHSEAESRVRELNSRFRQVPVFGRDTIRRFSDNVSEMKQMAARDFEDALQCFIPVIDRLLPSTHDAIVLDLLFDTATLHALHKLRLHVDSTVHAINVYFPIFTTSLRRFKQVTCAQFDTTELPKEARARMHRQQRQQQRSLGMGSTDSATGPTAAAPSTGLPIPTPRRKDFNMNTYKLHSLGDYPTCIVSVGTLDSHTTQIGELAHRIAKRRFARTSKKDFTKQMTDIERREARLLHMSHELSAQGDSSDSSPFPAPGPASAFQKADAAQEELIEGENAPLSVHHYIARSQKVYEYLPHFVRSHLQDPAAKDFVRRLKEHLLRRLDRTTDEDDPDDIIIPDDHHRAFHFEHERMYRHQTLRVNYTTYDVRRGQDIIHVATDHCHVMVRANEDLPEPPPEAGASEPHRTRQHSEPMFWYAKVLGIYHVNVLDYRTSTTATRPRRMEFLHIRWFGRDPDWRSGWAAKRLDRVGYVPESDDGAFDFLDPDDVIRGCHLIPAFAEGRTSSLLGPSALSRPSSNHDEDWERFYVNRFVDRDMFMRYLGGAVGHQTALAPSVVHLLALQGGELRSRNPGSESEEQAMAGDPVASASPSGGPALPDSELGLAFEDDELNDTDLEDEDYDSDVPFALL
ncbi:hypothetical protein OH77DRAFT_141434 [Trametes cingulata]|nr:hypothetical protein OH77DRAFT_141434 [Trametes cingulata]